VSSAVPRPAWSEAFTPDVLTPLPGFPPLDKHGITREWAWGGSTGAGVKVAVIDSGIDADHPAIGGHISGYVSIRQDSDGLIMDSTPHRDQFGHGTACAGIIRSLAPECELFSVQVLGPTLTGSSAVFAAGVRWAIEHGMDVCNLSLGTSRREFFGVFHELTDLAYFRRLPLVCAANNVAGASYPSLYGVVLSVAAHDGTDPEQFYANPLPPVEFGAPGIDIPVPWLDDSEITVTGNSFAAPHITGHVARLLGKHPHLTVFEVKTILRALADNAVPQSTDEQSITNTSDTR